MLFSVRCSVFESSERLFSPPTISLSLPFYRRCLICFIVFVFFLNISPIHPFKVVKHIWYTQAIFRRFRQNVKII